MNSTVINLMVARIDLCTEDAAEYLGTVIAMDVELSNQTNQTNQPSSSRVADGQWNHPLR
jgi:hypothetical protein